MPTEHLTKNVLTRRLLDQPKHAYLMRERKIGEGMNVMMDVKKWIREIERSIDRS